MLNLTVRLKTLHTLSSSKLRHHLLTIYLYKSNILHEFFHYSSMLNGRDEGDRISKGGGFSGKRS